MRAVVPVVDGDEVDRAGVGRHHHRVDRPGAARRRRVIVLLVALAVLARRTAGCLAGEPAAAPADPWHGGARDHPDVRVLLGRPARRPRGTAARRHRRPRPAGQRRGASGCWRLDADVVGPPARRPRPGPWAGRRRAGRDTRERRPVRRRRPHPRRQLVAGELGRSRRRRGGDAARPHRAAVGDRRARRRARAHRLPALADPRGRQPAAHRGVPHRDGPGAGRGGVRHHRARGRAAADRPRRGRRGRTRCVAARSSSARAPRRPSAAWT